MKSLFQVPKMAFAGFSDDKLTTLGAALAYYTIFSIAPLLVISIAVAGLIFGAEASSGQIIGAIQGIVGDEGAKAIQTMIQGASERPKAGLTATILGILTLAYGASNVFAQLQDSLNIIWKVQPIPGRGFFMILRQRFLSFAMIVVIAFLLLVSLVVSAGLAAVGKFLSGALPGGSFLWQVLNFAISFGIITALFASIFKVLPDVKISWKDVWRGAAVTALLFTVGKTLIGLYLGKSSVASAYGAAGSLVIVLIWVFYSSVILLFGAEMTRAYMQLRGHKVAPKSGARFQTVISESGLPDAPSA